MILVLKIILGVLVLLLVGVVSFGVYRHLKTQSSTNQRLFLNGKVPSVLPNGLYKGKVTGIKVSWQGKKFDREKRSGINIFRQNGKTTQQYPFKLYIGKGLADNIDVIKIDYNIPQNPLWLRFIVDEIVETKKNNYLGKLHVRLPFFSLALGYFSLEK